MYKAIITSVLIIIGISELGSLEKEPSLIAESAILYDYTTGRVLFEKNADMIIPPASMTKLITLYLCWQSIESGKTSRDQLIDINHIGSSFSRPNGSSLMLLEEGQKVSFLEIMKGLAVSSGNDAAYALAYHLSGSKEAFVQEMNKLVDSLGYKKMHFDDPDGWSSNNRVTAREYAQFSADYIREFPYALKEIHSLHYFMYPKLKNIPEEGGRILRSKKKSNTNILLGKVKGVDGLKTGYIEESGFNFTATANRGISRFIAVVMGIKEVSYFEGINKRGEEAKELLEYGYRNFTTIEPSVPLLNTVKVWEGKEDSVMVELESKPFFTLSREEAASLTSTVSIPEEIDAPVRKNDILGTLTYSYGNKELKVFQLVATKDIAKGNIFKIFWHKIVKIFI